MDQGGRIARCGTPSETKNTMQKLTSYAAGSWHEGTGEGVQIHNPTSGEAIAGK